MIRTLAVQNSVFISWFIACITGRLVISSHVNISHSSISFQQRCEIIRSQLPTSVIWCHKANSNDNWQPIKFDDDSNIISASNISSNFERWANSIIWELFECAAKKHGRFLDLFCRRCSYSSADLQLVQKPGFTGSSWYSTRQSVAGLRKQFGVAVPVWNRHRFLREDVQEVCWWKVSWKKFNTNKIVIELLLLGSLDSLNFSENMWSWLKTLTWSNGSLWRISIIF